MSKPVKTLLLSIILLTLDWAATAQAKSLFINETAILAHAPYLNAQALHYAAKGYTWAVTHSHVGNPYVLTVIDFTLPADAKRMWVIDLRTNRVVMNLFTTQGKNSGTYYATRFSNQPNSDKTSLGVFKTLEPYYGKHGLSERLQGLEPGINDNAYRRAVVIHPAVYASPRYVYTFHGAGRSWGCFGINPSNCDKFVSLTKGGSIIFAYAPPEKRDRYISAM